MERGERDKQKERRVGEQSQYDFLVSLSFPQPHSLVSALLPHKS